MSDYLPLNGSTMTGTLYINSSLPLYATTTSSSSSIFKGDGQANLLSFKNSDASSYLLFRQDANNFYILMGTTKDSWSGNFPLTINNSNHLVSIASASDRRVKNYIKDTDYEESVGLLRCTPIRQYIYKTDTDNIIRNGVFAQDIIKYVNENNIGYRPYIIINPKEPDPDNMQIFDTTVNEESVFYSLDYEKFIPDLWNGWRYHDEILQQQQKIIEEMKLKIEELTKLNTVTQLSYGIFLLLISIFILT